MARPIRNTPTLYGEDAEKFISEASTTIPIEIRKQNRQIVDKHVSDFINQIHDLRQN